MASNVRRIGGLLVACAAIGCAMGAPAAVELTIETRARALVPGEPLRVLVTTGEPLTTLEGAFLGHPVTMTRIDSSAAGFRWSGWAMIGLDQQPGSFALEMHGTANDGRPAIATVAVTILEKSFPEERLEVSSRYVKPPQEVEQRLARERGNLERIYKSRVPRPPALQPFLRPVPGEPTSIFGTRRIFNGEPRSPHSGLDLRADSGDEVRAAGEGRVVLATDLYYSGNTVILDHGGGLFTLYAHLSSIAVEEGQEADAGKLLGRVGATGRVTGPHLHWGAKIGDRPFNPEALLDPNLWR